MRAYLTMLDARLRGLMQYRVSAIAGIGTQLFFGFVRVMVFVALFRSTDAAQPMTQQQVISYIWLSQAFLYLAMFGVEAEIGSMIRSGSVGYELTRPVDLYSLWLSRCVASRLAPMIMRGPPQLIIAYLLLGLDLPASAAAFAMFLIAICGSVLLAGVLMMLFTVSLLWTISGEGISRLGPALVYVLSGIVIPLPFFPDWLQPLIASLPFRGLLDVPLRIYLGHMPLHEAMASIAQQWLWIGGLIVLGRWLLAKGVRQLVVQGG